MKFANYIFNARGVNNLGDNMQIIAIDNIYRTMGIAKEDIVYIDTQQLSSYCGEYVILPVTMPMVDYQEKGIAGRFSPYIIPVFLGLTMVKETLEEEEVQYLKKYEPIGCRDERTLNTMRRYQIRSYLHGCITVTLPKREICPEQKEIFIVSVSDNMMSLIPDSFKKNAIYRTHLRSDPLADPKSVALMQYQEYKDKARLVITALLHCALPCLAAGIPVILLKEQVSYRMGWLEKLIPIYSGDNLDQIDWDPTPPELTEHKKRVLRITIDRLKRAYQNSNELFDLSWFYENREKSQYINDACASLKRFIDETWKDHDAEYFYSIWGLTQMSEWMVDYIEQRYPNAKLCHVYDAFRKVNFRGLESTDPRIISDFPMETVLVTTNGAQKAAEELFRSIGKKKGTYAFLKLVY